MQSVSQMLNFFLTRKGQYSRIVWERSITPRKGSPPAITITKQTTVVCRAGIDYEKMSIVKESRANGELPEKNQGLKGKAWLAFPFLLTNTSGEIFLRVYPNNGQRNVQYFLNGNQVSLDSIRPFLLAKDQETTSFIQDINLKDVREVA